MALAVMAALLFFGLPVVLLFQLNPAALIAVVLFIGLLGLAKECLK